MTNEKPLISICIPTYNRCKSLQNILNSIVQQNEFLEDNIEIVVSDNASTDETKEMVAKYIKEYRNIVYFRNKENLKDKNFPLVLSEAHGKLRRLCNDTFTFRPGSLKKMCSIVNQYNESRPFIVWTNEAAKCENNIENVNFSRYIEKVSFWMTSIACFSIWDSECDNIGSDFDGCELSLWQVKKGLEIACRKDNIVIVDSKMTDFHDVKKNVINYDLFNIFYNNYFSILNPYFESGILGEKEREYLEKDLLFRFFVNWVAKWELQPANQNNLESRDLKEAVWNAYSNKPYWNEFLDNYNARLDFFKAKQHE